MEQVSEYLETSKVRFSQSPNGKTIAKNLQAELFS
jgi:hypothetical protein